MLMPSAKAIKQTGLDIQWQEEFKEWQECRKTLKSGKIKACALIFQNYCTKAMQSRIEEHPDFETKIRDDPIALLEAIKTLTHDPVRAWSQFASETEALNRVVNLRQSKNENLPDYVKQFK